MLSSNQIISGSGSGSGSDMTMLLLSAAAAAAALLLRCDDMPWLALALDLCHITVLAVLCYAKLSYAPV